MNDWDRQVAEDKIVYDKAIKEAFDIASSAMPVEEALELFKKEITKIFEIGFKEGQQYAGLIRTMHFHNGKVVLPGDEDYDKEADMPSYTMTYSGIDEVFESEEFDVWPNKEDN
jgi:hypothetical protein